MRPLAGHEGVVELLPEGAHLPGSYSDSQLRFHIWLVLVLYQLREVELPDLEVVLVHAVLYGELLEVPLQVRHLRDHLLFLVEHERRVRERLL